MTTRSGEAGSSAEGRFPSLSQREEHLEVSASLLIETPIGPVNVSGRGSHVAVHLPRSVRPGLIFRAVRDGRRFVPGLASALRRAGLHIDFWVGERRVATIGDTTGRGFPARLIGLDGMNLYPGPIMRTFFP